MAIIAGRYDPFGRITKPSPTYPGSGAPQYPMMEDMPDPMDREYYESRMKELFQPEMFASDRLNQLLQSYPDRSKYKPSLPRKLTSIAANLSSLGRPQLEQGAQAWSDKILNDPFYESLADWKTQIEPTVQAASNERLANVNLRTAANQIISQEQADRRIQAMLGRNAVLERQGDERNRQGEERVRQGDERIRQGDERIRQGDERIKIARLLARGGRFQMDKLTGQGRIIFTDGITPSVDVDINQIPQADLLELLQNYGLERIDETAQQRTDNRASRYETVEDPDNPGKKILVEIPPGGKPKRVDLNGAPIRPTVRGSSREETQQLNVDAIKLKSIHPGGKYIQIRNGRYEGITAPGLLFGPSKEVFEDLKKQLRIDPAYQGIGAPTTPVITPTPATSSQAQPRMPLGTIGGEGPNKGKTYVRVKGSNPPQYGWVTNPDPNRYDIK